MSDQSIGPPTPGQGVGPDRGPSRSGTGWRRPGDAAPRPFAAVPHDLVNDDRLGPTAVRVAAALLQWARGRDACYPADSTIGARIGRSVGTVQRALRTLEAAGWIAREKTAANRTGRLIVLLWRLGAGARPSPSPMTDPPRPPAREEWRSSRERESVEEGGGDAGERPRPETPPAEPPSPVEAGPVAIEPHETADLIAGLASSFAGTPRPSVRPPRSTSPRSGVRPPAARSTARPPEPRPATKAHVFLKPGPAGDPSPEAVAAVRSGLDPGQLARLDGHPADYRKLLIAWLAGPDELMRGEALTKLRPRPAPAAVPASTAEVLARIRECPTFVSSAAESLSRDLDDRKSWSAYHAIAMRAYEGAVEPETLVRAYGEATSGRARCPGAIFMTAIARESKARRGDRP